MRARRSWLVLALLLVPAGAAATGHKFDASVGPEETDGSRLRGLHAALALTLPEDKRFTVFTGFSFLPWGSDEEKRLIFVKGARWTFRPQKRVNPFVQMSVGIVQTIDSPLGRTEWVYGLGGGIESFRSESSTLGFRVEGDVMFPIDGERHYRVSVGVVFRLHPHH